MQSEITAARPMSRGKIWLSLLCAGAVAALIVGRGLVDRRAAQTELTNWTEAQALPVVGTVVPSRRALASKLLLPGRLEAFAQAQLYARSSGYLKSWKADIGAQVKAGDALAEIDAPDLDQQVMQAEADLANAQQNLQLAKVTLDRGESLISSGAVSKSVLDQRAADFGSKQAQVRSAQANVDRLRVLVGYKKVVAPFDGLVTARNTDVGALINAGGGGSPLYVISDTSRLRLYVNVPQNAVPGIHIGDEATLSVLEYPGRTFRATIEASSRAVDVASGTTRMQLVVDNANGELMTGDYANVTLVSTTSENGLSLPANALLFNRNGVQAAVITKSGEVEVRNVTVARDFGSEVELASGIGADDSVIVNPPDGLATGDHVRIASTRTADK